MEQELFEFELNVIETVSSCQNISVLTQTKGKSFSMLQRNY